MIPARLCPPGQMPFRSTTEIKKTVEYLVKPPIKSPIELVKKLKGEGSCRAVCLFKCLNFIDLNFDNFSKRIKFLTILNCFRRLYCYIFRHRGMPENFPNEGRRRVEGSRPKRRTNISFIHLNVPFPQKLLQSLVTTHRLKSEVIPFEGRGRAGEIFRNFTLFDRKIRCFNGEKA